ncbi:unnamed protein product [Arctogadus glacialis]
MASGKVAVQTHGLSFQLCHYIGGFHEGIPRLRMEQLLHVLQESEHLIGRPEFENPIKIGFLGVFLGPTKKLLELLTQEGVPVEVGLSRADALQLADTALGEHLHSLQRSLRMPPPLAPLLAPLLRLLRNPAKSALVGLLPPARASERGKPVISVHGILITTPNKSPTRTSARFYTPSPSRCKASAPGWMLLKHQAAFPDGSRPTTRRRSSPRRLSLFSNHPARLPRPPQAMHLARALVPRLLQPPR